MREEKSKFGFLPAFLFLKGQEDGHQELASCLPPSLLLAGQNKNKKQKKLWNEKRKWDERKERGFGREKKNKPKISIDVFLNEYPSTLILNCQKTKKRYFFSREERKKNTKFFLGKFVKLKRNNNL